MILTKQALTRLVLVLTLTPAIVLSAVACGSNENESAPRLAQPEQTGRELADRFLRLIQQKDMAGLQSFLSDAFIIQRAEGMHYTKSEYLQRLPELGPYTISDVQARQHDNTLVVRYSLSVQQVVEGRPYRTEPAPRLSTFVWADGRWQMTSHANFNTPAPQ